MYVYDGNFLEAVDVLVDTLDDLNVSYCISLFYDLSCHQIRYGCCC